jgi:DAACS family dicarboxylate/amino acid:cation (Na+ or H+) symporter
MRNTRTTRILLGFLFGIAAGILAHFFFRDAPMLETVIRSVAQPLGQLFLRLIFMIVVPLVFSSLVLAVFDLGGAKRLGRIGVVTTLYTIAATSISVLVGIALVMIFKPGVGFDSETLARLGFGTVDTSKLLNQVASTRPLAEILLSLVPRNPVDAAARALEGEMVALMVFALIFGAALGIVRHGRENDPLIGLLKTVRDASMKIVDFAMELAPLGVAGLMFSLVARLGVQPLLQLGGYIALVIGGLAFQQLVVFSAVIRFLTRFSPLDFLVKSREVMMTAFSTSSSNATLPTAIQTATEKLGIDRRVASFVLTVGATANQNGTALFEGVTILFLAQVFQVELSFSKQIMVLLMSVLAGIGTAGVPGGSIPLIMIVMQSVGVPAEGIAIILGVDRLLDMCRTVLNVSGDLVAAAVVERWSGSDTSAELPLHSSEASLDCP